MFAVQRETRLSPPQAWARIVDWPAHGRWVPLTRVTVPAASSGGDRPGFVARTGLGRFGFDDPMEIVAWDPPRYCRIEKRGSVMRGWAELSVEPRGDGSLVIWREEAVPARLPRALHGVADRFGRRVFGRALHGLLAE